MRLAILDDYQDQALRLADWDKARARGVDISVFREPLGARAAEALAPFDAVLLMRERQPFPAALIAQLPNLKLVILTGARAPTLDVAALTARGVPVCNTSSGATTASTTELAWALLMSAARRLNHAERLVRSGRWHDGLPLGTTLAGKRLGVIGLGKMGTRMAQYARAFELDVVAWSPNLTAERAAAAGARLVTKSELLATSDFVTIHLVLGERSRGLIDAAALASMKQGAVLINTSRGPIVDEAALLASLRSGHLGAAGFDVFDDEPLPAGHPLTSLENVVLSPHLGYVVRENFTAYFADALEDLLAWLDGKPVRVMNPEALGRT